MSKGIEAEQEAQFLAEIQNEYHEVYSDDPADDVSINVAAFTQPTALPLRVMDPTIQPCMRPRKRTRGGSIKQPMLLLGELPTATDPLPGSYFVTLGLPDRPTVKAIVCEDGELYIYPHDCFSAAGFKDPHHSMLRLEARFGDFDTKLVAYNGRSRNKITMGSPTEVVRILELYSQTCRKDTSEFNEVIRRLKTYIV